MVKLIATDLDGTLLDENRRLPEGIFGEIETLHRLGILFVAASGRQYANLSKLFAPVKDIIVFLCENGALVKYKEKTLHLCPVEEGQVKLALDEIRAIPHLFPIVCGERAAYVENTDLPFYRFATEDYTECRLVENLDGIIGKEPVCKIAVFDGLGSANNSIRLLPQRLPALRTILSGQHWCDVSSPLAYKGNGIRRVREYFRLQKEECVAFGDHMNDYEMLMECGAAYVTENAYPPLKALVGRTVPANSAGGVAQKIKEIIKECSK